tara:strand:+ start:640 stop:1401 length:762 start_codon:yes stop_codon:yes gene_type:complete
MATETMATESESGMILAELRKQTLILEKILQNQEKGYVLQVEQKEVLHAIRDAKPKPRSKSTRTGDASNANSTSTGTLECNANKSNVDRNPTQSYSEWVSTVYDSVTVTEDHLTQIDKNGLAHGLAGIFAETMNAANGDANGDGDGQQKKNLPIKIGLKTGSLMSFQNGAWSKFTEQQYKDISHKINTTALRFFNARNRERKNKNGAAHANMYNVHEQKLYCRLSLALSITIDDPKFPGKFEIALRKRLRESM